MADHVVQPSAAPPPQEELRAELQHRQALQRLASVALRWREGSILLVAVLLFIYFQLATSTFLSGDNMQTLGQFIAPTALLAFGEVMLLICGEIDLSVGQVFALAPFIMYFANQDGLPLWLGIIVALIASALIGVFNGLVTVLLQVPSFITTLGTLFLVNGLTLTISGGSPVATPGESGYGFIMGHSAYAEIIWAIVIGVLMYILLNRTPWGVHTIATGGNATGAAESGININAVKVGNFIISATLAGLVGILEAYRITSTYPLAGGTDIMFNAVVAAVIGGTVLAGGSGTIIGAFLGAVVLGVLNDGFTLEGVSAYTYDIILGAAILVAMVINIRLGRLRLLGR